VYHLALAKPAFLSARLRVNACLYHWKNMIGFDFFTKNKGHTANLKKQNGSESVE